MIQAVLSPMPTSILTLALALAQSPPPSPSFCPSRPLPVSLAAGALPPRGNWFRRPSSARAVDPPPWPKVVLVARKGCGFPLVEPFALRPKAGAGS